jgi:hypothetical protein
VKIKDKPDFLFLCFKIINFLFSHLKLSEQTFNVLFETSLKYMSSLAYQTCNSEISKLVNCLFNYFKNKENASYCDDKNALKLFTLMSSFSEDRLMVNSKLYFVFYSYKMKRFDYVHGLLYRTRIELDLKRMSELQEFYAFHFFKGLIFLTVMVYSILS